MYNISIQMFRKNKEHGNANGYITQYKTPRLRLNLKLLLFLEGNAIDPTQISDQ